MAVYIVLSGGLLDNGELPCYVKKRIEFVKNNHNSHDYIIFSSLYSLNIAPVINDLGFPVSEAVAMKEYYMSISIQPYKEVFVENSSFDTIGSAFFLRKMFQFVLVNEEVIVVTSDFHRERTEYIFKKIWNLIPVLNIKSIEFFGVQTNQQKSSLRIQKERNSLIEIKKSLSNFSDLEKFSHWIFTKHDNYKSYNSSIMLNRGEPNELRY